MLALARAARSVGPRTRALEGEGGGSRRRWRARIPARDPRARRCGSRARLRSRDVRASSGGWPRDVAGVPSWAGIQFDEFSFEVKKCADAEAANALVREFCASDGLTERFCQTAVDVTFLAHQQKRPADEIVMLQELATIVMREFRRRNCAPEQFLSDELMRRFRSADVDDAKRGDGEAARRLAAVRAELRRVFLRETQAAESGPDDRPASHEPMSPSKFLTHLEKVKSRCADDRKWERSIALKAMDANESAVQEYIDPMEELRLSAEALEETMGRAAALQDMFREEIMNR